MIAVISPAKNMKRDITEIKPTIPSFPQQTRHLAQHLKQYSAWQLEELMHINPKLAMEAFADFQDFCWDAPGTPALLAYHGLQYRNIGAKDFTVEDFAFANEHLRIISGFYGLLRPSDQIQPYRLEMGGKVRINGMDLYRFWGDTLRRELFASGELVIDLASKEYGKAVWPNAQVPGTCIACSFLVMRSGKLKTLATLAKMARGQMVRQMVKKRWTQPQQLQQFTWEGFCFDEIRSQPHQYVYVQNGG